MDDIFANTDPNVAVGGTDFTDYNPTTSTQYLDIAEAIAGGTGTGSLADALKGISSLFTGTSSLGQSGQLAGILGVAALANKLFGSSGGSGFAGYQGSIPTYTASRTMNTIPTTMTIPTTGGGTQVVPRRPGSGGVTYFSPMVYTEKKADGGIASLRVGNLGSY